MEQHDYTEHHHLREKLTILKSPLVPHKSDHHHPGSSGNSLPNLEDFGERDTPNLQRHDDASTLETFFDLFFAANYTVFTHNQSVTNHSRFKAYVGYFCLLWLTWFVTTLYDVRFVTDSIFERTARAAQLGVLVGFAVVAPSFDPDHQEVPTMRTMSIILCISRAVLAIEYGSILWHCRKYKKARVPLWISVAINVAASAIYLGITFRFHHTRSRVFMTWYFISGAEAVLTLLISNFYDILSFTKTHLMKRMSLLTVLILGDGTISIAENIVEIVEKPGHWNPTIIGIVTAATATVYFVFLIYFDWMKQLWSILHLPFNLALVLFMAGFEQFIIWSKIVETFNHLGSNWILWDIPALMTATTAEVQRNITDVTNEFFTEFHPKSPELIETVREAIKNITHLPNTLWPELAKFEQTDSEAVFGNGTAAESLLEIVTVILSSMSNAVFETFEIEMGAEIKTKGSEGSESTAGVVPNANAQFQIKVQAKTWQRYRLVFAYGYIAAGSALILMTVLTIVSRIHPWKVWPLIRTIIYILLGIGVGLVAILFYHPDQALDFLFSSWVLPTVTFLWFAVLCITHIGHTTPLLFKKKSNMNLHRNLYRSKGFDRGDGPYLQVGEPQGPWNDRGERSLDMEMSRHSNTAAGSIRVVGQQDGYPQSYGSHYSETEPAEWGGHTAPPRDLTTGGDIAAQQRSLLHYGETEYRGAGQHH
ncbi:hypothetical protein PT974_12073 [Cladobotryum mycophilum]|uniref:Low temperature requirement A n=1 Tax=Cladobotryum mycophilum TaxID=491253 RepID=A0ABR0S6Z2_9HYPO